MVFYNNSNTIRIFFYDSAQIRYNISAFYISILTLYVNTFLYNASNNNNNYNYNNDIINNIFSLVTVLIKINSKLS